MRYLPVSIPYVLTHTEYKKKLKEHLPWFINIRFSPPIYTLFLLLLPSLSLSRSLTLSLNSIIPVSLAFGGIYYRQIVCCMPKKKKKTTTMTTASASDDNEGDDEEAMIWFVCLFVCFAVDFFLLFVVSDHYTYSSNPVQVC